MSCGCTVWPRCPCDGAYQPTIAPPAMRPTLRIPPPDKVAAYLRHREAITAGFVGIDARWDAADELWEGMTESEHDDCVAGLGADWRPRR